MLFLDGVGKPRGTTLILSSTLGASRVSRRDPPFRARTHVKTCHVWVPCSRLETGGRGEEKSWTEKRGEAWTGGEKERSSRDEWERNRKGGEEWLGMTGATRPKGGKIESKGDCWWPYCWPRRDTINLSETSSGDTSRSFAHNRSKDYSCYATKFMDTTLDCFSRPVVISCRDHRAERILPRSYALRGDLLRSYKGYFIEGNSF